MKKSHYIVIVFVTINFSCSNASKWDQFTITDSLNLKSLYRLFNSKLDSSATQLNFKEGKSYAQDKAEIKTLRLTLKNKYLQATDEVAKHKIIDSANHVFTRYLLNTIIPYWYGTPWDFNGYTSIPKQGTIACGYFVSTTLNDMGLNVNRYKLAQQTPEREAKSIAINQTKFQVVDRNDIIQVVKGLNDGLYFVGLSNHVGYLYIHNSKPYFIHSNYFDGQVMIENALYSIAFTSKVYYISTISRNSYLIKKWLTMEEIKIETE